LLLLRLTFRTVLLLLQAMKQLVLTNDVVSGRCIVRNVPVLQAGADAVNVLDDRITAYFLDKFS
jgi:hypothetical protein